MPPVQTSTQNSFEWNFKYNHKTPRYIGSRKKKTTAFWTIAPPVFENRNTLRGGVIIKKW